MSVPGLLSLAHGLASALARWHGRAGRHGGLCPEAVRVGADGQLTLLNPERRHAERTSYAAPEQSGRLSRDVDERADLYALGVVLYELATGALPFGAAGPAELVRAQLTSRPKPASELRRDLPKGVDGVLAALLARLPEDRYQSIRGVLADLRYCQDELAASGDVATFPPGRYDVPGDLAFTGRLYGRRSRLTQLTNARDRVAESGGVELVPVTADPGLGKTALLGAFGDAIVVAGGWVARTAFSATDPAPYAALARLLADLVEHLTMRCGGDVASWRTQLAGDLGRTAPLLARLVPELGALVDGEDTGTRQALPGPGRRAQTVLRLGIRRLLTSVAAARGPLVLVLDDLHRADPASIEVLRYVLSDPETTSLLVVAGLRPKEIPGPVAELLREHGPARSGGTLNLRPMPDSALTELLADTLRAGPPEAAELARVVAEKTGSRPLAVAEFLRELRDKRLLTFDEEAGTWRWERVELTDAAPVHEVLPAIQARLVKLPERLLRILQLAAMIGEPVEVTTLAKVTGVPVDGLPDLLRTAVREGLLAVAPGTGRYRWPHEVFRRAVSATLPEAQRGALVGAVARALLPDAKGAAAHRVVELCLGSAAASVPDRAQLAERALAAGRHAYQLGAVEIARDRLLAAVDLLPPSGWARRAPLAYAVHLHGALTARAAGDLARADSLLDLATGYAAGDLARAEVLALRARWRRADGQHPVARSAARQALDLLGVALPADPSRWDPAARAASGALTRRLADIDVQEFSQQLMATDPRVVLALEVIADAVALADPLTLGDGGPPADAAQEWAALLAATGVRLAFDFGPTPAAALAFAGHAATLARRAGHRDHPDQTSGDAGSGAACAARVALALVDSCPAPGYAARVAPVVARVRALWYDPEEPPLGHLDHGYRSGIEDGEPTLALDNLVLSIAHRFVLGTQLGVLADEVDTLNRLADRYRVGDRVAGPAAALADALARLAGTQDDAPAPGGTPALARTVGLMAACLAGDYPWALELAPEREADDGSFLAAVATFYRALALAAQSPADGAGRLASTPARLDEAQARLDAWASHGPAAFDAYAALLGAERARLAGDGDEAAARYRRAVDTARKSSLGPLEALAAELGGRHALTRDEIAPAVAHLRRARDCYHRWRAPVPVARIDQTLLAVPTRPNRTFDQLDLFAIVRAFQEIAGELSQDRLVVTLLGLLVEHTNAERGALLLPEGAGLRVAATALAERGEVTVVSQQLGSANKAVVADAPATGVPETVVEHVLRRGRPVGGRPAELPGRLARDRYLREHPPAALLCTPLLRDGRLVAVLYLEHGQLSTWFGSEHLDLLDVLCAQAAIALDNASVHARLLEANQILDAAFDQLPVGLILLGPDLIVRRASPEAVALTGLPIHPGTPLMDLFDVLTPTDADGLPYRLEPVFAPVGERGEQIHRDVLIVLPGGGRQRVHTSAIPLRNDAGDLIGVTLLVAPTT